MAAGDLEAALAAVGKIASLLGRQAVEVEDVEELQALPLDSGLFRRVRSRAEHRRGEIRGLPAVEGDLDVVEHRHVAEEADVLKSPRDPAARDPAGTLPRDVGVVEADGAGGGRVDAGDDVEHGRLPRAVRADEPVQLAGLDLQIQVVDGDEAPESHRDVGEVQDRHGEVRYGMTGGVGAASRRRLPKKWRNSRWPRMPCGRTIMMTIRRSEKRTIRYWANSRRPSVSPM